MQLCKSVIKNSPMVHLLFSFIINLANLVFVPFCNAKSAGQLI
nr:MAG TPA: hypothetical protein [Caudoviricetes sp.]